VIRRVVVLASFVTLAAGSSWAQDHRVEIGAVAGYTFSDGVTGNGILAGNGVLYNGIEPKDSFSYGFDIGFFLTEHWEVGGLFSQQKSTLSITGPTNSFDIGDMSVDNYHGVITYNFGDSHSKTRLYVMGGAGGTHYSGVNYTSLLGQPRETNSHSQFSTTWGLGAKIYPANNVGLKLGFRWTPTYVKSDYAGWWCDPYWGCYVAQNAQYSNQFEFAGGLSFRF